MEGNIAHNVCPKSLGWLQRQDNDAKPWLWKFSNCFSTPEQNFPLAATTNKSMESKKAPVELKEAPPAHHPPLQPFAAVPLPDVHSLQPKQIQLSPNPKVSCCSHGSDPSPRVPQLHFGGGSGNIGGGGNSGGGLIHPGTVLNAPGTGTITWQIGSELACPSSSISLKNGPARSNMAGTCRENPVPPCPHFSCCGKLHFQACHGNLHKLHPFPPHPGCTTPGYFSCSEFSGAAGLSEEHLAQPERMPCVCTNSLHLKVSPPLCLKGSHHCTECLSKSSQENLVEAAKMWPDIPPPNAQVAPLSLPMCNGCGTKGTRKEKSLLLASSFGQLTPKHGSPEIAISNQLLENLPPIGVFWDIENCSVPSGRSAVTVVQRIREKFFKGHREAEFICVCDISKENKEVIEELNNCQVTVAHINATAKNAADDKLRQSLRRFADTHAAPATVVLVSTDVNFALELSDLRHRHGFHIILVHKNQASEALLHHAHELIRFEEFISDLPPRLPLKKTACHTLLYVYNLPTNRDSKSVCLRLRRLSDNCGGKVLTISGSGAILRFLSQDSAERAQKRMENEDVFGNRITVSFTPKNRELAEAKNSGSSVADKAKSPKKVNRNAKLCLMSRMANDSSSTTKAVASKGPQGHGSIPKNTAVKSLQVGCFPVYASFGGGGESKACRPCF
ncbi:PREDICTED: meiosis arrest female protein 1 homolog [Thamnophis sirtalis]|uniref:Meiosis arrest female protein 1 homolog n=1 Tax=Thamnophis sirtalis TaxID=35019 RepID=A0A6I9YM47_9SAUR|nr:PREDICTED: meiosis arrest female protein 1 homolog [Thamnophis sirtalis]